MALQSQHVMVRRLGLARLPVLPHRADRVLPSAQVGGLLLLRFHLVSPPSNVIIYSIKVKINQHFTIISPTDPARSAHPPTDVRTIFVLDGNHPPNSGIIADDPPVDRVPSQTPRPGPLKNIKPEEEYKIYHLARMPNDSILRPSTHELTESAIRVRHDVAMEVTYRVVTPQEAAKGDSPKPKEKELKGKEKEKDAKGKEKEKEREKVPDRKKLVVSKPLEVFSVRGNSALHGRTRLITHTRLQCCCFVDSLTLPAYSFNDPALDINEEDKAPPCLCGFKMGQCVASPPRCHLGAR